MTTKYQSGFTLIEVLIAASIFSSVILLGVATFTKMNQLSDKASELRSAAEEGRFAMDAMTRSIAGATGDSNVVVQGQTDRMQSVQLCGNVAMIPSAIEKNNDTPAVGFATATASTDSAGNQVLTVKRFAYNAAQKQLNQTTNVYNVSTDPLQKGAYVLQPSSTAASSVTSNAVTVDSFAIYGVSAVTTNTAQPFVTIVMSVKSVPIRASATSAVQQFRTSVVVRDYNWNLQARSTSNICSR